MDRGKMSSTGRGGKSKAPQHPQDIFALGSKSTVVVSRDSEKRNIHKPTTSGVERKREATTSFGSQPPGKRSRIGSPAESVSGTSLEVDPVDLVPHVLQALDTHNSDKLLGLLTGSIRLLKSQRSKPDPILCMSMLYLVKIRPNMFAHETVTQSLCSLLKREQGAGFKSKGNPLVFVLACNMLYAGHKDNRNWPDTFIKVYIEDALNERWWVECAWCRCLVENIVTAFNTKLPPASLIPTDNALGTMSPSGSGSPLMGSTDEDTDIAELEYSVFPRYSTSYETVEGLVLEAIKEQLQRRAAPDAIGKGFLKLLAATCGFPEIRMISASRLEAWLHSGKLWRAAQELLAHVCVNADAGARDHEVLAQLARMRLKTKPLQELLAHVCVNADAGARDHEVLAQLARMRLKTKPLQAAYITCLKEMVSGGGAVLRGVVTHTIYNELSNVRSANNLAVLAALLQAQPAAAPRAMSDTYLELLMRPDEYLRPLRALTRECVRGARGDAGALLPLCRALCQPPPAEPAPEVRERAFSSIADLVCLCCLVVASHRAHVPDYKQTISQIQAAAMGWLLDVALPIYKPTRHDYQLALNKILFVEPADTYSKLDNWPPESERVLTHRLCSEAPLPQATLLRLVFIGLHKEIPISPAEALDLFETLVRRLCALPTEQRPLTLEQPDQLPDYLFQLAQFQPADSVQLPAGYTVPPLAISALYWRCWCALVMLCAHSPGVAHAAAQRYPTLRALIDAAITDKPSIEWSGASAAEAEAERAAILQLEGHLAAASHGKLPVTEHNCRLLSQLTTLDPLGPARKPPAGVLEAFQQQASSLRLGALLCRQPALLLELVQRHGTRRAMPWLHQLLQQDQLQLSVLPVQCLCEFLSGGGAWAGAARGEQLAAHLRRTVADSGAGALAVLQYYTQRLAHQHRATRAQANRGLKLVLTQAPDDGAEVDYNEDVDPMEWIEALYTLPHWESVRSTVISHVLVACLAECRARAVAAYVACLARHVRDTPEEDHDQLILGMSQLIMERGTIVNNMLPAPGAPPAPAQHQALLHLTSIFHHHLHKVRVRDTTDPSAASDSAEGADALTVRWAGWSARMHTTQAHAHLKLLCYGPSNLDTEHMYDWLETTWSEAAGPPALLPDWLRLHLVRCARPTLLALGLRDVSPMKLALFIQTFGVPVPAVTALLQALDQCPASSVARIGVERAYMSLLLRVQRGRGARGGQAFAAAARLAPAEPIPEDTLFESPPVPTEAASPWVRPPAPRAAPPPPPAFGQESPLQFTDMLTKISAEVNRPETPYTTSVIQSLLTHVMAGHTQPSPLLLRALLPHTQAHATQLLQISETLLKQYKCAIGPLVNILRQMRQQAAEAAGAGAGGKGGEEDDVVVPKDADTETIVRLLESCTPSTLEAVGERIIRTVPTQRVVAAVCAVLQNNMAAQYDVEIKAEPGSPAAPAHVLSRGGRGTGLLLDWLAQLQADTLGARPERQMRLIFRAGCAAWRPLLATQLAHRASWRTLHACLTALLQDTDGWAPHLVLQFASTLARSPRVWQGRDKAAARHHAAPELLQLNHQQLCVLVRYILEEGDAAFAAGGYEATCRSVSARLPLLLQCCRGDSALLCAAATAPTTPAGVALLLLLYMKVPKILQLVSSCHERPTRVSLSPPAELQRAAAAFPCATDAVSHCLLCAQTPPDNAPKDHTHKMYRLEGGVRALWARHPRAAARAVPLVAALLRGAAPRAPALTHLLAALEMVPDDALFSEEHTKELSDIVECLMSYAASTSGGALLHRAAALLRRLAAHGSGPALLQAHRHTVASIPALSGLVTAGGDAAPSSAAPPPHALLTLQRRRDTYDELQAALQEIDQWGTRRGGAWGGAAVARSILAAAAPLLAAPHAGARKAAAALLVKLLPAVDDTTPALHAMLECLESPQAELAQTVLDRLGELVCGAQEHAARLLARVFELGARGRLAPDQAVAKCVSTINLLRGC